MGSVTHHMHKRKRIYKYKEPYPHPNPWKRFLDKFIYFIGLLGPVLTIPQIAKIWSEQDASSLSLITWVAYLVGSICFLLYAIAHKEKPLIIIYSSLILVHVFVLIGIMLYG